MNNTGKTKKEQVLKYINTTLFNSIRDGKYKNIWDLYDDVKNTVTDMLNNHSDK